MICHDMSYLSHDMSWHVMVTCYDMSWYVMTCHMMFISWHVMTCHHFGCFFCIFFELEGGCDMSWYVMTCHIGSNDMSWHIMTYNGIFLLIFYSFWWKTLTILIISWHVTTCHDMSWHVTKIQLDNTPKLSENISWKT